MWPRSMVKFGIKDKDYSRQKNKDLGYNYSLVESVFMFMFAILIFICLMQIWFHFKHPFGVNWRFQSFDLFVDLYHFCFQIFRLPFITFKINMITRKNNCQNVVIGNYFFYIVYSREQTVNYMNLIDKIKPYYCSFTKLAKMPGSYKN